MFYAIVGLSELVRDMKKHIVYDEEPFT